MAQTIRDHQDIETHIDQQGSVGMANKIQTFGFLSAFARFSSDFKTGGTPNLVAERLGHE